MIFVQRFKFFGLFYENALAANFFINFAAEQRWTDGQTNDTEG
jgi:hypothetical protein